MEQAQSFPSSEQNLAQRITDRLERALINAQTPEDIGYLLNLSKEIDSADALVAREIEKTVKMMELLETQKETLGETVYQTKRNPLESKLALLEQTLGALQNVTKH